MQVEEDFNSIARLEIPIEVFIEIGINALLHRDYYQTSPIRVFIFDDRVEIHSPGILPHAVTEQSIKEGISHPRNELLFNNARFILPYTGVGSGVVRALNSYDNISFENNLVTEEFVTTIRRLESNYDTLPSAQGNAQIINTNNIQSVYDSDYDSDYDNDYDNDYDGNHDKQILAFASVPKSRKEIMDLLGLGTHTDNYERHITPLLQKGLLAMTLPDKPKSKHQKYVTTEKGKRILNKNGEQKK